MLKKIMLSLIFSSFTTTVVYANSAECYYYTKQAKYFQDKVMEAIKEKNFCKIADYAELSVNYLGSAKKTCTLDMQSVISITMEKMSTILLSATLECGH